MEECVCVGIEKLHRKTNTKTVGIPERKDLQFAMREQSMAQGKETMRSKT